MIELVAICDQCRRQGPIGTTKAVVEYLAATQGWHCSNGELVCPTCLGILQFEPVVAAGVVSDPDLRPTGLA
jgi:hypothetical protein